MCQTLEKVFNQKLATMPAEVRVMKCLVTSDRIKRLTIKTALDVGKRDLPKMCF